MPLQPLRDWINWKPAATLGVAVLMMGGSAAAVVAALRPPAAPTAGAITVYVIDEQTGHVTRRSLADAPSDDLVRAVFRPGEEPADGPAAPRHQPLYLRKYTPDARQKFRDAMDRTHGAPTFDDLRAADAGCLVRAPESGSRWVPAASAEGARIVQGTPTAGGGSGVGR